MTTHEAILALAGTGAGMEAWKQAQRVRQIVRLAKATAKLNMKMDGVPRGEGDLLVQAEDALFKAADSAVRDLVPAAIARLEAFAGNQAGFADVDDLPDFDEDDLEPA